MEATGELASAHEPLPNTEASSDSATTCVHRSRRFWKPNVQKTTLYSNILERNIQLKVTAYALRLVSCNQHKQ